MRHLKLALFLILPCLLRAGEVNVPRTGLVMPPGWEDMAPWKSEKDFVVKVYELPSYFDWRFYAQGLTPVRRQAWNDCWAQGSTGMMEALVKIAWGVDVPLSVQHQISCSGQGSAARGGYFTNPFLEKFGIVTEQDFPYAGKDLRCPRDLTARYKLKKWGYVGAKGRRPKVTEIKQALMEHGPLPTTITANGALSKFRNKGPEEVFRGCSNGTTNHIELIVAWSDELKAWLVRNSWGPDHGYQGYAWIPWDCSRVGEAVVWGDLDVDLAPAEG